MFNFQSSEKQQQNTNFVLIEFPGVVKNVDKALDMLGGTSSISQSYFVPQPLELRFNPDNQYHPALVAERRDQNSVFSGQVQLVIRVRRRKKQPNDGIQVNVLGTVSTSFSFKAIADFQYLPIERMNQEENRYEDIVPKLYPTDFSSALSWWEKSIVESKTPSLFLPPYLYSRYNTPSKFILYREVDRFIHPSTGHARSLRNERKALTVSANAKEPFPAGPTEAALNDVQLRCKVEAHHKLLTEMFNERPLWTRTAIAFKTQINENLLKVILAKYAFYITSGPWGRLWCRFGYDPRQDPDAKKYQIVMVTFKMYRFIPERHRLRTARKTNIISPNDPQFFDYAYRTGTLPSLRQMSYCICDVYLPVAQKVLRKDFYETLKVYDENSGWLPLSKINEIRMAIKEDLKQTIKKLHIKEEEGQDAGYEVTDEEVDTEMAERYDAFDEYDEGLEFAL